MCKECPPLVPFPLNGEDLSPEEQDSKDIELLYGIQRDRKVYTDLKQDMLEAEKEQAIYKEDMKVREEELNSLDNAIKEHEDGIPSLKECTECDHAEFTNKTICPDCGAELKTY